MQRFLFPRWVNPFLLILGAAAAGGGVYALAMGGLITDPKTLNIGYEPEQPVPFSHAIHAGQLKMDCRYCHNTVFEAAHAAVPPTATCINCHRPGERARGHRSGRCSSNQRKTGSDPGELEDRQEHGVETSPQLA